MNRNNLFYNKKKIYMLITGGTMTIKDEVLEYFSQINKNNVCFPKMFIGNKGIMECEPNTLEIFNNCGEKEGLESWVIKKKYPIYLKKNPEILESDNNYIFLKTYKKISSHRGELILNPTYYHEIYYWIGNISNIKKNFSVAYYSTLLSYQKNTQKIIREEKDNESEKFKNLFLNN